MKNIPNIDVLEEVQDIHPVGRSGDNHIYAAKPSLEVMRQFYEEIVAQDATRVSGHWVFGKDGIKGSSFHSCLGFDADVLRPRGLWLPGLVEGKTLDSAKKLSNGVYRDYGIVLYDGTEPNHEIAERLASEAEALGLKLPLVIPFRALNHSPNISFVESPEGIISGKEAEKQINVLNYKGNSGVRRLLRDWYGGWDGRWGNLAGSSASGRVDWVCGEATRADLTSVYDSLAERKYGKQIRELQDAKARDVKAFEESLKR